MRLARLVAAGVAGAALAVCAATPVAREARAADAPVQADVSVFYAPLAMHGGWLTVEPYGWVWAPEVEYGWRPYSVGYWAWVDGQGWTWVSDEPFAWAVYHYGRWAYHDDHGWIWVPGTVWAPAWAEMRMDDTWIGWAPIPPQATWTRDAGVPTSQAVVEGFGWTFIPIRAFGETDLAARAVAVVHVGRLLAMTTRVVRPTVVDGRVLNVGLDIAEVERIRGGPVRRYRAKETVDPAAVGSTAASGEEVIVVRPVLVATPPTVEPPRRRSLSPAEAKAWMDRRAAEMGRYLERQRQAAAANLPSPSLPPPPAELERIRQGVANALERERLRIKRLFERGP